MSSHSPSHASSQEIRSRLDHPPRADDRSSLLFQDDRLRLRHIVRPRGDHGGDRLRHGDDRLRLRRILRRRGAVPLRLRDRLPLPLPPSPSLSLIGFSLFLIMFWAKTCLKEQI